MFEIYCRVPWKFRTIILVELRIEDQSATNFLSLRVPDKSPLPFPYILVEVDYCDFFV